MSWERPTAPWGGQSFPLAASLPSPGPWEAARGGEGQARTCVLRLAPDPASFRGRQEGDAAVGAACLAPPLLSRAEEGVVGQGRGGWVAL